MSQPPPPSDDPAEPLPRQSFFALLPKRELWKALSLLVLLAGIVYLRCRSDKLVHLIGSSFPAVGPASSPSPSAPASPSNSSSASSAPHAP